MNYQANFNRGRSLALPAIDNRPSLSVQRAPSSPSPGAQSWNSDISRLASSRSPSLYSVPSAGSTPEFPTTPPPDSSLLLPQVPVVPAIRHRTPQACDKCRERKTKCSGHHPICVRCSNRGLKCNYSTRETRIRGATKPTSPTLNPDGQPHCRKSVDANGPGYYGRPTPAHHSRMGYSQTSAFTRAPPVGDTHDIEEEFGWHTCQNRPVSVASRFGPDSWLSLDSNSTYGLDVSPKRPDSVGMPLPARVNEIQDRPHAQTTLACSAVSASFLPQESGFGYPNSNCYVHADHVPSIFETGEVLGFSEGSAMQSPTLFLEVAGEDTFSPILSNDADCFSSSNFSRGLSAFQNFEEPATVTNNSLDRFAFFC